MGVVESVVLVPGATRSVGSLEHGLFVVRLDGPQGSLALIVGSWHSHKTFAET